MTTSKDRRPIYLYTVLTFLENMKHDGSSGPRRLTPSERRSLWQHARETSAFMQGEINARKEAKQIYKPGIRG